MAASLGLLTANENDDEYRSRFDTSPTRGGDDSRNNLGGGNWRVSFKSGRYSRSFRGRCLFDLLRVRNMGTTEIRKSKYSQIINRAGVD